MLTIEEVFKLADTKGLKPKPWGSYVLKTYNGFTHEQRVRKWQTLNLAVQMGLEQPAHLSPCSVCGISGGPGVIAYHSEDYGSMSGHHPICKGCHTRAHNRFTNPQGWLEYIASFSNGSKWFENLSAVEEAQSFATDYPACTGQVETIRRISKTAITSTPQSSSNISAEMHQIRVDFTKALGLDWSENPSPSTGYKYEHNLTHRQQCLDEARRLRDQYAEMVNESGRSKGILDKMDSNLENRDKKTAW